MTNLNKIMDLLNGDELFIKIDELLDEALRKFIYSHSEDIIQKEFINVIHAFFEYLNNNQLIIISSYTTITKSSEVILFSSTSL